jgi:hypothetical protein
VFVRVGEIISLPWFSKELKTTYRRTTGFVASSLYLSFANQYSLGGGFSFPIVLVPRYKLSLCHSPIKPDLLGFQGIGVFACGLCDHVITRFASLLSWFYLVWFQFHKNRNKVRRGERPKFKWSTSDMRIFLCHESILEVPSCHIKITYDPPKGEQPKQGETRGKT